MKKYTKKKIENIATNEVSRLCASNYLEINLPTFSNEPSYDGTIYYYPNTNANKKGLITISVQVKGTTIDENNSFSFELIDLENYMNNNGILLFVVKVRPKDDEDYSKRVLAKLLMPKDIKKLIKGKQYQKTISIQLKQIFNVSQVLDLCKQYSILNPDNRFGVPFMGNEKLALGEKIKEINLFKRDNENHHLSMKTRKDERYYIENIKTFEVEGSLNIPVKANNKTYYNRIVIKQNENIEIKLSNMLSFEFRENKTWELKLGTNDILPRVIHNLQFLNSIKEDTFFIGNNKVVLNGISFKKGNPLLEYYEGLKLLRDYLEGTKQDVNINVFEMSEEQQLYLSSLAIDWAKNNNHF